MVENPIYLDLSDDVQQLLSDNRISIEDILRRENIAADISYAVMPFETEAGARSKDVVTVILASSAAALLISYAISKVLSEIAGMPHYVKISVPEEVRDANNNVLLDQDGKPIFKLVEKYKILEPRASVHQDETSLKFGPVVISVGSKRGQPAGDKTASQP